MSSPHLCSVALLSRPYATLTYALPGWVDASAFAPGMRVAVPLGTGALRVGVMLPQRDDAPPLPEGVTPRPVLWPLDREPLLDAGYLDMIRNLALRQACQPGQILGTILPLGLRTTQLRLRVFTGGKVRMLRLRDLRTLDDASLQALGTGWQQGAVELLAVSEDAAEGEACVLMADPPWAVRPSAKRQIEILELLHERGAITRRALQDALGRECLPALASLVQRGLVSMRPQDDDAGCDTPGECLLPPPAAPFEPSDQQREALASLCAGLDAPAPATHLLFGVTGSGKTAVYLDLARACLDRGHSILLLAPEVALACKLRRDVTMRMPDAPLFFFHGYQSAKRRERTFCTLAARTEPCIVVGTRSALFLPVPDLKTIVLDEEHDASFKQDEGLSYQAKEVAWFRVGQRNGLLVLGSATPDLKTFHAAQSGHLPTARLTHRVGGGTLPEVRLIDIAGHRSTESILAPESMSALRETVERGEQAVLLLNRRGYAPLMYCLDCGTVARCPHCEIGLTYHKGREKLVCHYCGHTVSYPSVCVKCKGMQYLPMGEGTEKLEETLAAALPPGAGVLRLDRDSTRRPGRAEEILEAFARREAQVLVGTQMLSKGHHFPDVTLALVADGDLGLNLPDYRAAERTFQLLVQSSGRAGRGDKPGSVLIQTRDTAHYCWNYVGTGDYEGFYAHEIAIRERRRYPPFVRLALVRVSFPVDWKEGMDHVTRLAATLRQKGRELGVTVLGPAPAPLPLLRGRKRFQCLLKGNDWPGIRSLFGAGLTAVANQKLRVTLDLDPVNML